jgi:hypothetical protein
MKKTLLAILLALALTAIPVGSALAADTADVTVTATPGWVSITNDSATGNNYDFGVVLPNTDKDTGTGYFTITNASTVAMDINIKCDGWSSTGTAWTYGDPTSGDDTARLNASDGDGAYDVVIVAIDTDYLLSDAVAVGNDVDWELQLDAPVTFTYVDVQTTTVTITAVPD